MRTNNETINITSDVQPIAGVRPGLEFLPLLEEMVPGVTFPGEEIFTIEAALVESDDIEDGVAVFHVDILFQEAGTVESVTLAIEDCNHTMLPEPEVNGFYV